MGDNRSPNSSTWQIFCKTLLAADKSFSKYLAFSATDGPYRPAMKLMELSCHGIPWIILCIYALYSTKDAVLEEVFFNLLFALLLDLIIVGFLKVVFRRKRPSYNKDDMFATVSIDKLSFPSGHATRAYLVTWFILHHVKFAVPIRAFLVIWCHCVGFSRVILGRHHISDVVAGFLVGYWEFLLIEKYWFQHEACLSVLQFINLQFVMGEIRDWWSGLTGRKKLGYGIYGVLVISTLGLYLFNNSRYIYDPTKKKEKKQVSKWD